MVAAGAFVVAGSAVAQRPTAVRITTDNDAYLFWLPPWERTDHEYTSGVRGTIEYDGRARLLPLGLLRHPCAGAAKCATHSYSLGQELYTGDPPLSPGVSPPRYPSRRTNAGWLYVEVAERDSAPRAVIDLSVRVGVVGPPALGRPMQEFFHLIGPKYPLPADWSNQLPFEPGFVATVARRRVVASAGAPGQAGVSLTMRESASLGTILTGASAGFVASGTVAPPGGERANWRLPRLTLSADATGFGVLRDEFLDGTFFRASPRLDREPFYAEGGASIEVQWPRVRIGYRAARTGRRYRLQGAPFSYGTLMAEWRP